MTEQEWRKKFGANLLYLINKRGCTRRDFAEEIGLSEKMLDHYIHGRRSPTIVPLMNLARSLNCSMDKLTDFGEKVVK